MNQIPKLCIAGLLLVLLTTATAALADSAADLKQAGKLTDDGQYAQAKQVYEKILTNVAEAKAQGKTVDGELVFTVHKKLPLLYLATNQPTQARAGIETLLNEHGDREDLPHALHEIIEGAKRIDKTAQAGQLCQAILAGEPQHRDSLWLKMGVALANVYLKDDQAVNAVVQSIVAEQADDPWAAEALAQTGWAYDKIKRYDKSRPIYEYVVDNWSQKRRTIHAHTALVRTCIFLKDEQAAQTRLEQLVGRYSKDKDLPGVLTQLCRDYREAKMYQPSRQVSRYVLDNFPESDHCIWAQKDIVLCDIAQRAQEAAIEGAEILKTQFGDHDGAVWAIGDIALAFRGQGDHARARELFAFNVENCRDKGISIWSLREYIKESLALGDPTRDRRRRPKALPRIRCLREPPRGGRPCWSRPARSGPSQGCRGPPVRDRQTPQRRPSPHRQGRHGPHPGS